MALEIDRESAHVVNAAELSEEEDRHAAKAGLCRRVLMRCRDGEVVFVSWDGFDEEPALEAIVSRHPRERLEQPFL